MKKTHIFAFFGMNRMDNTTKTNHERMISKNSSKIETMFNGIAQRYDLLNHALSLGMDMYWRKKGIWALKSHSLRQILDVATGTGDLALQACRCLKPQQIIAIDISDKMMDAAKTKIAKAGMENTIRLMKQDCSYLPFADHSFDAVIMAFGLRNFARPDQALQEIARVLRPAGMLMILELSTPESFFIGQLYKLYAGIWIPFIGRLLSRDGHAYQYLPASVAAFAQNEELKALLEKNGFTNVTYKKLTFGICTLYLGQSAE
jgi:demethylmenaquinone methyltransferase/2-methoxy-6-polyprenyl-1,4-benzoquinol methylase